MQGFGYDSHLGVDSLPKFDEKVKIKQENRN
jgi:hypothetical protein